MDNTPTAAGEPVAPQTEAPITQTQTNTTSAPEAPQTASSEATGPIGSDLGLTAEQAEQFKAFVNSNGGFEKAFGRMKSTISNPQQQTQASADVQSTQPQPMPQQVQQPNRPPKGFASVQELAVERYFRDLAKDEKYASIADKIESGDVLKEMASMGMNPVDENYNINVNQLHQFLDLKAASVPTKPTSVEPTNIPTVDYVQVGENITDLNQALTVMQQSMEAQAKGAAPHPALAQAKEFLSKNWNKR